MPFHRLSINRVGYYVYALFDPRNNNGLDFPFYVGKGKGNRVFQHARAESLSHAQEGILPLKVSLIQDILRAGYQVREKIIRWGLSHGEAMALEAALIDLLRHISPGALGNLVRGHHTASGITGAEALARMLHPRPLQAGRTPLLIVKIDKKWPRLVEANRGHEDGISHEDYFDAARGDWGVSLPRVRQCECVLVVAGGIVRHVMIPEDWEAVGRKSRMTNASADVPDQFRQFVGLSVDQHFPPGARQLSWRYLNVP